MNTNDVVPVDESGNFLTTDNTEQEANKNEKQVAHALEVISQIGRLHKKHNGKPPAYLSVTGVNRAMKRSLQKERSKRRKTVYACNICKLPFTGVQRCQCKPYKAKALEVA